MKFVLFEIDSAQSLLWHFVIALICWLIFYYTVKAAIKNGILAAKSEKSEKPYVPPAYKKPEITNLSPDHKALQTKYEKGEITFEEYKSEWEKLK